MTAESVLAGVRTIYVVLPWSVVCKAGPHACCLLRADDCCSVRCKLELLQEFWLRAG